MLMITKLYVAGLGNATTAFFYYTNFSRVVITPV